VKIKFNIVKGVLKDRVVVIVDDSIVRAQPPSNLCSSSGKGAKGSSLPRYRSSHYVSLPVRHGFPTQRELIAYECNGDIDAIANELGVRQSGLSHH